MNVKILFASFALVFLAELGDKTQLTAMAFSASTRSAWSVFFGTSLALVTSTLIAVLAGDLLSRFLPVTVLHIASGVMFVLVGLFLLVNVARKAPIEETKPETGAEEQAGLPARSLMASFILNQAIRFEEDCVTELKTDAGKLLEGEKRDVLLRIIREDQAHIDSLKSIAHGIGQNAERLSATMADEKIFPFVPSALESGQMRETVEELRAARTQEKTDPVLATIQKEEAAAHFYIALAQMTNLNSARETFQWLAMEDIRHANELYAFVHASDELTTDS